ncbi:interferon-inducible GTPase 5-like [Simochromis diagramma]|uniref:interferon-inducible GTPase 5-like n=1 Tax=Simochromis diagramma TaxID=43689 RepID=UPI001A7E3920|nr:interferon-inducible GTPase 5-like [Simochromis diagramma]XP_039905631.1 interferon-inducible GTPase 5-like [Simochromis diagramma]
MEAVLASVKNDLMNNDTAAAAVEKIQRYLKEADKIPLKIAITGESKSGKSAFVSALRGIKSIGDEDQGAAPTGVTETTSEVTEYLHPNYPNVTLWDLPGIGTTKFPADKYLELVGFEKFDFFIIVSADRFRENDVKLAKEIQKMKKKFYFVWSKIDNNIRDEERKKDFSKEETLRKIRDDSVQGLQKEGFESPQVFLVSSFEPHIYEFSELQQTLERELPAHQSDALLRAMSNINEEIINKKKEAFQSRIKYYSTLSAAVAAVPVPGLSVNVDLSMMLSVVTDYVAGFGLNKQSLEKLAASSGVSYNDLCAVIKSELAKEKITKEFFMKMFISVAGIAALMAAEKVSRKIFIIVTAASMGISFTTTYLTLSYFLNQLADDAQRVFNRALGVNISV